MRTSGSRLRVTAQLTDVASGYQLWSERFDREVIDVFAIQDEIAAGVVEAVKSRLAPGARTIHARPQARNLEAYRVHRERRPGEARGRHRGGRARCRGDAPCALLSGSPGVGARGGGPGRRGPDGSRRVASPTGGLAHRGFGAWLLGALGEIDDAFDVLARAEEEHQGILCYTGLPGFDSLRADPRFGALLERLELPRE